MTSHKPIPVDVFDAEIKHRYTEVSTSALGGSIVACSDDLFAAKENLIKIEPSASLKGQFGPIGALYDAWESRRHCETFDWIVILLAPLRSQIHYVDIDTSHFRGNECPESQVFALTLDDSISRDKVRLGPKDQRWEEILPVVALGPSSRHIFELGPKGKTGDWSALMVRMIPDGGMARFRAFGRPLPPQPLSGIPDRLSHPPINLSSALLGARIADSSDEGFAPPSNLLRPGRGIDMSDGWETRRSQKGRGKYAEGAALEGQERREWAIIQLASAGVLRWVDVDTAFHPGNYPVACALEATRSDQDVPRANAQWTTIVTRKPLGSHRMHWFDLERSVSPNEVYTHVRYNIYPDGGTKRVRIFGYPVSNAFVAPEPATQDAPSSPALPLTPEAFAPYGQVIQGFELFSSAPRGSRVEVLDGGASFKFHGTKEVGADPGDGRPGTGVIVRCVRDESELDVTLGAMIPISELQRHTDGPRAHIPMGNDAILNAEKQSPLGAYIVVVALSGSDGRPDPYTLRAFMATAAQGVLYSAETWHQPHRTVDGPLTYATIIFGSKETEAVEIARPLSESHYAIVEVQPYASRTTRVKRSKNTSRTKALRHPSLPPLVNGHGHTNGHANSYLDSSHKYSFTRNGTNDDTPEIRPQAITAEVFAPYGKVILAGSSFDLMTGSRAGISVHRANRLCEVQRGENFNVREMQMRVGVETVLIPMAKGEWKNMGEPKLPRGGLMLIIVAKSGTDGRPDLSTLKSFVVASNTGIVYAPGIWHHPVIVLDSPLDIACIESPRAEDVGEEDIMTTVSCDREDVIDGESESAPEEESFARIIVPAIL